MERRTVTAELEPTTTDEQGIARLPFDLGQYDNGIYRLRLTAEGFEASGGQGVKAIAATLLSAASALVGYNADGGLRFIAKDAPRTVRFQALDTAARPAALDGLHRVLLERRYVSALVKQGDGTFAYQSVLKETELAREPFALPAEGADYALPTASPGGFALTLVDANGRNFSRVEFDVAGERNLAGNLERDAELELRLERDEYAPGEEIVMEITAPYAGTGLVTIERDHVHAFKWLRSDAKTTLARIRVPEHLEGNAYVNVAFVRAIDAEEIFVSPLSYAAAPFAIDRAARRLAVALDAPRVIRPGEELALGVSADRPARLVLYAVDEGILQVADYQTPDPLDAFLGKKALQVETHQMVDLILPDYDVEPLGAPGDRLRHHRDVRLRRRQRRCRSAAPPARRACQSPRGGFRKPVGAGGRFARLPGLVPARMRRTDRQQDLPATRPAAGERVSAGSRRVSRAL